MARQRAGPSSPACKPAQRHHCRYPANVADWLVVAMKHNLAPAKPLFSVTRLHQKLAAKVYIRYPTGRTNVSSISNPRRLFSIVLRGFPPALRLVPLHLCRESASAGWKGLLKRLCLPYQRCVPAASAPRQDRRTCCTLHLDQGHKGSSLLSSMPTMLADLRRKLSHDTTLRTAARQCRAGTANHHGKSTSEHGSARDNAAVFVNADAPLCSTRRFNISVKRHTSHVAGEQNTGRKAIRAIGRFEKVSVYVFASNSAISPSLDLLRTCAYLVLSSESSLSFLSTTTKSACVSSCLWIILFAALAIRSTPSSSLGTSSHAKHNRMLPSNVRLSSPGT